MRSLLFIPFLICVGTAAAQIEERPPVIRRSPSSPVDPLPAGKSSDSKDDKNNQDKMTAAGIVRHIDAKKLEVAIDDGRIFSAAIDSRTAFIGPQGKVDASTVTPGTRVRISVKANLEMDLTATSVVVEKLAVAVPGPSPAEDAATRKTEDDDEDRPVLKRGQPQKAATKAEGLDADSADAKVTVENTAPMTISTGATTSNSADESLANALAADNQPELLQKAHDVNLAFVAHLPNFVCQQYTTRYQRENKIEGWQAKDIISASVVYDGKGERYENIKINNKSANAEMMDIKGARSTGEFGSILEGLFARDVHAEFRYLHAESFRQAHTKVFAYIVKKETTDWTVRTGGQSIEPGYSGRVWINTETGRVMRIERQADNIPEAFPLSSVEQTLDYDSVMLGGRKILLPVESLNLSCDRTSSSCNKNVVQFRDYKEFRGAASVTFDQ